MTLKKYRFFNDISVFGALFTIVKKQSKNFVVNKRVTL